MNSSTEFLTSQYQPTLDFVVTILSLIQLINESGVIDGDNKNHRKYSFTLWERRSEKPTAEWQEKLVSCIYGENKDQFRYAMFHPSVVTKSFRGTNLIVEQLVEMLEENDMAKNEIVLVEDANRIMNQKWNSQNGRQRIHDTVQPFLLQNTNSKQEPRFGWKPKPNPLDNKGQSGYKSRKTKNEKDKVDPKQRKIGLFMVKKKRQLVKNDESEELEKGVQD